ncbi:MAG: putative manganese-dependent inorganic diphosphatase [Calditerrivibrio sp.]|nr:putative manganese-dependent inorganic diphosphatase [Calditerrivibrio sp.]MCA1933360.1 putative manganese-dependent inorganic diphosphatase [Calditerrivibrio sp.]MCA1980583.1 putative manganese-dependent inorganic diphosphatase [Calditerrivibrio sp.]
MKNVYVIGHKNPDTDSICSAYCYAYLKNMIDKGSRYIAGRCGNLNAQTKYIFSKFQIEPPIFIRDVYPKVSDVMTKSVHADNENDPLSAVMKNVKEMGVRLTPIVDSSGRYLGIASVFEIANFFANFDDSIRPFYIFRLENFLKTIGGYFIKSIDVEEFSATPIIGAMPYDRFVKRLDAIGAENSIVIVSKRRDIIQYSMSKNVPAIIVTGLENESDFDLDFSDYNGSIFVSNVDTAETARRLILSVPCKSIMGITDTIKPDDYAETAKDAMLRNDRRGLPVVDEDGMLVGIITRSDIIKKPENSLILMDHNELSQAVDGADSAEIVEIIDHHRLGTIKTKKPIYFYAKPVGSTCTLVYQLFKINNVEIDNKIARLLASGILADTVILKSPTTTDDDVRALSDLSQIGGFDYIEYGKEIFSATDSLKNRTPSDIINTDFKIYSEFGVSFGVGQVEVVNIDELKEVQSDLIKELEIIKNKNSLHMSMLLVTDIITENSILLSTTFKTIEKVIKYRQIDENSYYLPNVLSRKKQLLPEILRALEDLQGK